MIGRLSFGQNKNIVCGNLTHILEHSHLIILLMAPELVSLKSAVDAVRALNQINLDSKRVQPVINRTFQGHELSEQDVMGIGIGLAELPYTACPRRLS